MSYKKWLLVGTVGLFCVFAGSFILGSMTYTFDPSRITPEGYIATQPTNPQLEMVAIVLQYLGIPATIIGFGGALVKWLFSGKRKENA